MTHHEDDDHSNPIHAIFPFLAGPTPEMKEQMNREEMEVAANKAAIVNLFRGASLEELRALRALVRTTMHSEFNGGLFVGMIQSEMIVRFGADFDGETMAEKMQRIAEEQKQGSEPINPFTGIPYVHQDEPEDLPEELQRLRDRLNSDAMPDDPDLGMYIDEDFVEPMVPSPELNRVIGILRNWGKMGPRQDGYPIERHNPVDLVLKLKRFGLVPNPEKQGVFVCKCTLPYVTMEDRELREDCHGCLERERQG